jgi:tyrosyl-tRNA synthetase
MEKGLSFLEFNYMIMQSYDFYHLHKVYGCNMQFGGDDQWSNMLGGTELIRKKTGEDAYAMTITLLLNSEGKKMGKTAKGAVWLDENKTSPYEFYQYWRNIDDADVTKCLKMLTFIPLDEIKKMDEWSADRINEKKELLAFELTKMVHGEEKATKAMAQAKAAFGGGGELPEKDIKVESATIIPVLVAAGICSSNGEARRLIQQGGVSLNDEKVTDINAEVKTGDVLHKGKKIHIKINLV